MQNVRMSRIQSCEAGDAGNAFLPSGPITALAACRRAFEPPWALLLVHWSSALKDHLLAFPDMKSSTATHPLSLCVLLSCFLHPLLFLLDLPFFSLALIFASVLNELVRLERKGKKET